MAGCAIGMVMLDSGGRAKEAHAKLAAALPHATVSEPDDVGVFDIKLEADSQDEALDRVWDAVAASGADDHVAILEHPGLPEHWRHLARSPA